MFPDNLTRAAVEARSELISTTAYRVEVDLTGHALAEPTTTFTSTSEISFSAQSAGRTHLDLIGVAVLSATLDGIALDPASFADSQLPLELTPGPHVVKVSALCRYSRSGEGLHRFVDPSDDGTYLYTQFEVADARRVFACFEQPDLKARFTISVLAPTSWTVLSNSSVSQYSEVGDVGRWDFSETAPLSTYLTAIVAGDYHAVRDSYASTGGEVAMSVLCRRSLTPHLDAERILATTKSGFGVFEQHFRQPYAFGKYDQVFVPEYNGGAMENAGCVTFRDDYLFRSRVTAAAYEARDNTILHELSHMWFGNLVTMKWWDDLWLKESFAEWASPFALSQYTGDPDHPWATFCNSRKNWAYRQDQLPSTHPIADDMVDLEAVELNFDGITYAKGASVLRQLVAFVGLEAFLAGARAYFHDHAFGNTTLSDLLAALHTSSGRDLASWSAEWLEKPGVNTLAPAFELDETGRFASFAIEQRASESWPTLRSHRIAVGLYQLAAGSLSRVERIEVDIAGPRTEVPELIAVVQPDLVLLNDDDLTYAKVRLDERSRQTLITSLARLESPLARAVCWGAAWDMCRDAELAARDYVDLALRGVGTESDLTAVSAVLGQGLRAAASYTALGEREQVLTRWEHGIWALLSRAKPASDHQVALAKAYAAAVTSDDGARRIASWLQHEQVPAGLTIDTSLRWLVVTELARLGAVAESVIEAERQADNTIMGAEHAAAARATQPHATAKAEAWALAVTGDEVPNETHKRICQQFWQRGQEDILEPYVSRYFEAAEDISASRGVWATKGISLRKNVLASLFPLSTDPAGLLSRVDAWLDQSHLSDSVSRVIRERRDDTERALRCQRNAAA
ncbi:MAG TPA: aminopeptidase N [Propionibacteriaceae bacterium]|nr:aminopeptidase N [Propionibacteriaceae bacterium]